MLDACLLCATETFKFKVSCSHSGWTIFIHHTCDTFRVGPCIVIAASFWNDVLRRHPIFLLFSICLECRAQVSWKCWSVVCIWGRRWMCVCFCVILSHDLKKFALSLSLSLSLYVLTLFLSSLSHSGLDVLWIYFCVCPHSHTPTHTHTHSDVMSVIVCGLSGLCSRTVLHYAGEQRLVL